MSSRTRAEEPGVKPPEVSRRQILASFFGLLAGGVAAGVGLGERSAWAAETAGSASSKTDFHALASKLNAAAPFDPSIETALRDHLTAQYGKGALERLAQIVAENSGVELDEAISAAELDALANAIGATFYSGLGETADGWQVVTYTGALAWQAVPFTKPPSICGGAFGYWSKAPAPAKRS